MRSLDDAARRVATVSQMSSLVAHEISQPLAGILLVAFWVWQYIRSYVVTQVIAQYINMAYYDIKWFTPNFICLITGLAMMIVSQIILMGKELQEEQELTI